MPPSLQQRWPRLMRPCAHPRRALLSQPPPLPSCALHRRCSSSSEPSSASPTSSSSAARKPHRLQGAALHEALRSVSRWSKAVGKESIHRSFTFPDFNSAFAFMTRSALCAEQMQHHPAWFNVYNRVDVELETHDCQGLSRNDIALAQRMDEFATQLGHKGD